MRRDGVAGREADAPFVAIPAFLSRSFRPNGIYGPAGSAVTEPAGLAGGLVGVAETREEFVI